MHVHRRRGWEIPESEATPESAALARHGLARRGLLGAAGFGAIAAGLATRPAEAAWNLFGAPAKLQPLKPLTAKHDDRYVAGRAITPEMNATTYNNYYEFSDSKNLYALAQALPVDPWSIEFTGMVARPRKIAFDDLMKQMPLEERVTRHRCVEAWAMTVPWIGFPLAALVKLAEPLGSARYVTFTSLADPKQMPGMDSPFYTWPYLEGVTMAEAANDLAFISVGMYGKTLPPQNGAPLRLTLPWKYGFKHAKALVKIGFTDKRPRSFWENLAPSEYGFWANVNPAVPHPRWSQAQERLIGTSEVVPTQIWNGYGEFVASMYDGLKKERLFA
ncbi:MAG: protein-methionine-sulfoxide reductase catalytic subunit MsrP [Rhodospirillales bacterium]|nr:protein-methionine-sulfoxide reductase catalytic subunit MsrP [Rhodospirillales bacterium]MDE2198277.1 protein-methionine-sulfoxide reductase catalytic subunit MsrP [Rhodospirillales bacterium]MDE2574179.1 protein-methionine-sulfoxide reductase catalytic subunit MsrP [Rhodospirillales bacterium]